MTVTEEIKMGQLADLLKQMQAGNEVLLTQGSKLVAKLIPATELVAHPSEVFTIKSVPGRRVLTPKITSDEIAEELFDR